MRVDHHHSAAESCWINRPSTEPASRGKRSNLDLIQVLLELLAGQRALPERPRDHRGVHVPPAHGGDDASCRDSGRSPHATHAVGKPAADSDLRDVYDLLKKWFEPSRGDQTASMLNQLVRSSQRGGISDNESDAIAEAIAVMGKDATFSPADARRLAREFFFGAEKDGTFSGRDLKAFKALLSLDHSR